MYGSETVKMAINGIKAIGNGVVNIVRQVGTFMRTASEGEEAVSEGLGAEVEMTSLQTPLLSSGSVEILTVSDADVAGEIAGEVNELASVVTESLGASEATFSEVSEMADIATESAEVGEAVARVSSLLSSAASVTAAALGPILLGVVIVTEVLQAIDAKEDHDKLKKAAEQMDSALEASKKSLTDLKKVFTNLLKATRTEIKAYNKMLPDLYAVSQAEALNIPPFSTDGITMFIDKMSEITIDQNGTAGFQAAAITNLSDAQQFIVQHVTTDSQVTTVVKQLNEYMHKQGVNILEDNDPFLKKVADADSIPLDRVKRYNTYRRHIVEVAAMLRPYCAQVRENTPPDANRAVPPENAHIGEADPKFMPTTKEFKVPTIHNKSR